jgi:tetratricopeptide (TPR) repeat protein
MPVATAVERCEELLAGAESDRALRAALSCTLAGLRAMMGEVEEARRLYAEAVATYDELGLRFRRHARAIVGGQIEALAGDPLGAERELRSGYDALSAAGERGVRSVVAAMLADVHCSQGRHDDAERLAREVAAEAGATDLVAQVLWRSTLARVLAQRDDVAEAERLLEEARALTDAADFPDLRAGVLVASAEVADTAGRMRDARRLLGDARALYAAKGNVAAVAAVDSRLTQLVV